MKLHFTLLVATLFFVHLSSAQSFNRCSTMEHHDLLVNEGLAQANQLLQMDQAIHHWINNNPDNSSQTVTIPVVFHVIYANNNQNISDARILAQLDVMNRDYTRTNADTTNTPPAFLSVAANSEIQFCLALTDPDGNPTTGITRTQTTLSGFQYNGPSNQPLKFTAQGGKDIWPRNEYLNIWVVNFLDQTLGYAQFPGGTANTDGVVVDYRSVGGPLSPGTSVPYHLGRTVTHEIGHWLGVYHTFQNGCAGTTPSNCATAGDQVCDTPPVSNSTFFCPSNKNSCTESPDFPDMVTNFMDYTDDPCMNIFTQGQKVRMQATLNTIRSSLLSAQACNFVGINSLEAFDNSIKIFPNPSSGNFTVNTAFNEQTSISIYVFNILGEKVFEINKQNLMRSKLEIDLSNHSTGIYNVVFESNGYLTNRKLSITR
ncbi:MAG: M43 family zinc metalloprotease [Bacteroidia bacterium]